MMEFYILSQKPGSCRAAGKQALGQGGDSQGAPASNLPVEPEGGWRDKTYAFGPRWWAGNCSQKRQDKYTGTGKSLGCVLDNPGMGSPISHLRSEQRGITECLAA